MATTKIKEAVLNEQPKAEDPSQSSELTTTAKGGELATIDFEQDAGGGLENVRPKDIAIPFFAILQKGSPQCDELSEKHIEGARPGMVMNTVTGEIYDGTEGIPVIPCGFSPEMVEWKTRDSGGGFVARHTENDPLLRQCTPDERGRLITPLGNIVADTKYHFVVHPKADGSCEWAIVSMASTQLKKSRNWLTMMKKLTMPSGKEYPSFSHIYRLTTVGEKKDTYSWYGWKVEVQEKVADLSLYTYARDFSKAVATGAVQVSAPPATVESEDSDNIPF